MDVITLAMAKSYTDSQRLASSEVVTTEVFPEQDISHTFDESAEMFKLTDVLAGFVPAAGQKYIVTVNGIEYETVVKRIYSNGNAVYLGNNPNAGEYFDFPWSIAFEDGEVDFIWSEFAYYDTTLSIRQETETIVPIDPKYLPGAVLPVVELSTKMPEYNYTTLTESESSKITEMAVAGMPFILKVGHDRDERVVYAVVMNYTTWFSVLESNTGSPYVVFTGTIHHYKYGGDAPGVWLEYDPSTTLWRLWSQFSV